MMRALCLFAIVCVAVVFAANDAAVDADDEVKTQAPAPEPFTPPKPDGEVEFFESFSDDSWKKRWTIIDQAPYTGHWDVSTGHMDKGIEGDNGLIMTTPGTRHAIAVAFDKVVKNEGKTLVVQYEVRAENKFGCDGGYIKLLSETADFSPKSFRDGTPYTIMFGPDKCGSTDKVHFILRHKNPKTGDVEEKHLKDAPRVPADKLTHVYTLVVRADNSYEILIDGASKSKGSLFENLSPAINPPKEIDDPSDKKPEDWVDEEYISDPDDRKPEDWDENAPQMIPDPAAVKPEGWQDNAPQTVPDPEAKMPSDWDEDEDGEWEAPQVPNPVCVEIGCGEWKRPTIKNPAYKGKWSAKKIKNPEWVGVWAPRQIPNPAYVEDKHPSHVTPIAGLGIELLTNAGGLVFDNLLVTHDEGVAARVREQTWDKRHSRELEEYKQEAKEAAAGKPADTMGWVMTLLADYPIPVCIGILTLAMIIFLIVYKCCLSEDVEEETTPVAPKDTKKHDAPAAAPKAEAASSPAAGGARERKAGKKSKQAD